MTTGWILLALGAVVLGYAGVTFNRLVRLRNLVREAWSGIDVQLKRRADLVPNLVEAVKGYAAHERGLFEEVAARRAGSVAASGVAVQAAAERAFAASVGKLMALAENYPQLKADQNFRELQSQLADIEDQLQMARRYYNGTVRNLNISIERFPATIVARAFGFREEPFFELDDRAAAAPPQVEFAQGRQ